VPCEFEDVSFAEFLAWFQVWRAAQNCQLFFGQTVISFLAGHFSPRPYHTVVILQLFGRKRIHNRWPSRIDPFEGENGVINRSFVCRVTSAASLSVFPVQDT